MHDEHNFTPPPDPMEARTWDTPPTPKTRLVSVVWVTSTELNPTFCASLSSEAPTCHHPSSLEVEGAEVHMYKNEPHFLKLSSNGERKKEKPTLTLTPNLLLTSMHTKVTWAFVTL